MTISALLVTIIVALVIPAATGTAVISKAALLLALTTFVSTQAAYIGLWKPHAVNATVAPGVGIG